MEIKYLMALSLGLPGLILIFAGILVFSARQRKRKRCSFRTAAVIVGNKHFHKIGRKGHRTNYGIYEYEYRGKNYQKRSYVGTTSHARIGKEKIAYVNPNRPEECIIEAWVSALAVGLLLGFGMLFVMIVLVFVLVL